MFPLAELFPDTIQRVYADTFREVLLLEDDEGFLAVQDSLADEFGIEPAGSFEIALANVKALGRPEERVQTVDGVEIHLLSTDHLYTSAWLREAGDLFGPLPEHGILVAAPTQGAIFSLVYPPHRSLASLQWLARFTWEMHGQGPEPLATDLMFLRPGRVEAIRCFVDDLGEFIISPPASAMPWFGE